MHESRWGGLGMSIRYVNSDDVFTWTDGKSYPRFAMESEFRMGWPARALRYIKWEATRTVTDQEGLPTDLVPLAVPTHPMFRAGIELQRRFGKGTRRRLPLDPLPLGFALDTIFYFVVFASLTLTTTATRLAWRIRHHRCPRCNYDLATEPRPERCPECGHAPRTGSRG